MIKSRIDRTIMRIKMHQFDAESAACSARQRLWKQKAGRASRTVLAHEPVHLSLRLC